MRDLPCISHEKMAGTAIILEHLPLDQPNAQLRGRVRHRAMMSGLVGHIARIILGIIATNLHPCHPEVVGSVTTLGTAR